MIFIGGDHRGFDLKERLKKRLFDEGTNLVDLGNNHKDPQDDYVIFAKKVAEAVRNDKKNKGILLCGSGVGVDMVANKIRGIRSALVFDMQRAVQSREHEDANIVSLPADMLDEQTAYEIVQAFLTTEFSGEQKHVRRLQELAEVEKNG